MSLNTSWMNELLCFNYSYSYFFYKYLQFNTQPCVYLSTMTSHVDFFSKTNEMKKNNTQEVLKCRVANRFIWSGNNHTPNDCSSIAFVEESKCTFHSFDPTASPLAPRSQPHDNRTTTASVYVLLFRRYRLDIVHLFIASSHVYSKVSIHSSAMSLMRNNIFNLC